MANILTGKVWSLDTVVGAVTTAQLYIHAIRVRFTTAGAGSCVITANRINEEEAQEVLLDLKTAGGATALTTVFSLDQQYTFGDQMFAGLNKLTSVNVDTIYVVTGNPR